MLYCTVHYALHPEKFSTDPSQLLLYSSRRYTKLPALSNSKGLVFPWNYFELTRTMIHFCLYHTEISVLANVDPCYFMQKFCPFGNNNIAAVISVDMRRTFYFYASLYCSLNHCRQLASITITWPQFKKKIILWVCFQKASRLQFDTRESFGK